MPQKFMPFLVENIHSVWLTVITGIFYGVSLEQANLIGEMVFNWLSVISVLMLVVINLKKFIKSLRSWASKDKIEPEK